MINTALLSKLFPIKNAARLPAAALGRTRVALVGTAAAAAGN